MSRTGALVIAVMAALGLAAPVSADEVTADASGAVNLTASGVVGVPIGLGRQRQEPAFALWAQPTGDGTSGAGVWQLAIRRADSAPTPVPVRGFSEPPRAQIDRSAPPTYAYYSRCAQDTSDCDIVRLDVATRTEIRVPGASSADADEVAPSIDRGVLVFVRSTGARRGIYRMRLDRPSRAPVRLATTIPLETAVLGGISRVAYVYRSAAGYGIAVRRLSGNGPARIVSGLAGRPRNLRPVTQYRVAWLTDAVGGVRYSLSSQIRGRADLRAPIAGNRLLPEGTDSFSGTGIDPQPSYYLAAGKLWRTDPGLIVFRF